MHSKIDIRPGSEADSPVLIELFDEAVAWMVARGQTGQWGEQRVADRPNAAEWVHGLASGGGLRIAELDHVPAGALVVGKAPKHIPDLDRPELYINLIITSRRHP